ncbi:hypothetical protein QEN19_002188 [Hanseniaspora menglaensis]
MEKVLGLQLISKKPFGLAANVDLVNCDIDDIINSITEILEERQTYKYDYQTLYNKIYNICLSDSPKTLYNKIELKINGFFEKFSCSATNLNDFIDEFNILNEKFIKIDSLFIYLNKKIKSDYASIYNMSMLKYKDFVLLNESTFAFLECEILKTISIERDLYQKEVFENGIDPLNKVLNLMKKNSLLTHNFLSDKIFKQFENCFLQQLNSFGEVNNIYTHCKHISLIYKKDMKLIENINICDDEMKLRISSIFVKIFVTSVSLQLISDEMFITNNEPSMKLIINGKYFIDYIYTETTADLINSKYMSFLYHSLAAQIFQIDKSGIKNRKDYLNLLYQLSHAILHLYQTNIDFIQNGVFSVENSVNNIFKSVLDDFLKLAMNKDDKFQLGTEENKWYIVLTRLIDNLISVNEKIDMVMMTNIIKILDTLDETRFEEFLFLYENLLSKRLLNEDEKIILVEYKIIKIMESNLDHQIGRNKEQIARMAHMVNDLIAAKKFNKKFVDENRALEFDTNVKVLNEFFWGNLVDNENSKFTNLIIPDPLLTTFNKYQDFYSKNYEARQVKWLYQHWQIDFELKLNGKFYLFKVPFITSIIFYHIIENDFVTIKTLKKLTGLPTKQIVQNLATLSIKYGIILHYVKDMNLSEEKSSIKEGDFFGLNNEFSSDKDVIKMNVISITKK